MSFATCLARLQQEGVIDRARADRYGAIYDQMEKRFKDQYGAAPGEVLAGEETLKALEWDAALRRRQAALQVEAQSRALSDIDQFNGGAGTKDASAVIAMIARDDRAPYASIEGRSEVLDFQAHAEIAGFLTKHRRGLTGRVRNKADLADVVRARHGDAVDNPEAKAFSDALGNVFEGQRQHFNLLGGDIGYDAKYGLSHRHDARRVRAVPYEQWRADLLPELAPERMVDPLTGRAFTAEGLEEALSAVYQTIRTDGLDGLLASGTGGAGKLANRRSDSRFLQFRDGDAWLRYNDKYGASDPFTAITDQIHSMNRDIAMMERFGPNPRATVDWLKDQVARRSAQSDDPSPHALNRIGSDAGAIDKVWRIISGEADIPMLGGPVRTAVTRTVQGARDVITAAKLGKAVLTALGDMATLKSARHFNGLIDASDNVPALGYLKDAWGYMKQLNPANAADRELAIQLELGMRDASSALMGLNRFFGQTHGPAVTKAIADTSLRITGLNAFTEAGQRHFGKTFLQSLAIDRGKGFTDLAPELQSAFARYGMDAADWDAIRAVPILEQGAGKYVSPRAVREAAPEAAEKMMDMVLSETAAAVQSATVRGRALTEFGNPGTFAGEAGRSLLQFKTFAASLAMTQGMRIAGMGGLRTAGGYAARLVIGLTLFGAMTLQLRQITYGQDMRPMDNWEFWVDALLQGGGLSIFGDVIGSFEREGAATGLSNLVGGPLVGAATDLGKATFGNAFRAFRDKDTHTLRDLTEFARKNTPGGNTWYASLAFQRLIFDQLKALADPDFEKSVRRSERRAAEQGTGFFWRPGDTAPARAPDLSNVTS